MSDGITGALRNAASVVAPDAIRRRFGAKFAVAFIVVLVVIAGAGVFAFQSTETTVEHQTTRQLAESNQLEADAIGAWMEQQRTHARSVSQDEALRDDRRAAPYILLKDQLLPADVVSMHLVNETRGTVVASTELAIEGRSLAELDAPWTTAAVPEGPGNDSAVWATEQSYRSPVLNDEPVMAFASSVPKREGAHLVVVTRIQPQVDRLSDANSTRRTTILNTGDEPVLDSNSRFDAGALTDSIAAVRNDTTAATTTVSNGRVYALSATPHTDWVTVTSVDTGEAFAVRDTVGQTVTVLVVLAVISLAIVGVALGRHTVTPLKRLRNRAQDIESGTFDVDLSTRRIDEVGRLYGSFDDMRVSLQDRIQEAEAAVEEANAAKAEAEELRTDAEDAQAEAERAKATAEAASERLQERAADYSEVMRAVADGDLTERLDEDADEEAMRAVATEFNAMLDGLEATIAQVAGFADEVADETLQVATGAEEIETTSQTVSERIQEIADGAIQQHDDLERAAGEMDELSASIQEVAASSATVAETAADAVERGEAGRDAAESAIDDMAEIESLSADAVDQILALQERMSDIGDIIEFITDIAEQTNMLALNANIEAARADKGGDGFAVVANEVKDLAEETKQAAADIESEIQAVQAETDETVADIRATSEHIDDGVSTVEQAAAAIEDTVGAIEDANHGIQEISDATEDQADATQSVVRRVDDVADISQHVTEDAEQVSAAAEEQSASVAEIARSADDLRDRADALATTVNQFETRADADEPDADATVDASADDTGD
ncbi:MULTISPECIES: chemotaxis signal transducer protein Htr6 [Halobacterium]|uniref:chemotaxis signal transducer protein Htr6 n=1 Tax=Halobacterium TaxID=2239 RepID=UPI00196667EC|nr:MULTISPECIES: chemotaxis signal transducer protein Htr6 [Halobacterium]MDL0121589.1 chemotaxis signal transducer protein Htr6 [Halobacterium salinarum]QRY25395.1 chemotaxis signal transducer protein Htr6 [Halobacterium sp. BOL4-2]